MPCVRTAILHVQHFEHKNAAKSVEKTRSERLVLLNASDVTFRQALLSCNALECMKCNIIFWHSAECFLTIWFLAYLHGCFGGIVCITVLLYVCDE